MTGLWFPAVKLWDYNECWSELEASDNPFATVVMAHLKTKATRKDNQVRFRAEQERIETEKKMRYVTSVERLAKEEGREEGLLRGQISLLKRLLKRRYRQLPTWVEERLGKASREELESWADRVLDAESLDEVFAAG